MYFEIEKASGKAKCRYQECQQNPEYIDENGRIKAGTNCVVIFTGSSKKWHTTFYCRGCVDKIYEEMKKIFNTRLWAFH